MKLKKVASVFMAAMLSVGLLAGCGGGAALHPARQQEQTTSRIRAKQRMRRVQKELLADRRLPSGITGRQKGIRKPLTRLLQITMLPRATLQ